MKRIIALIVLITILFSLKLSAQKKEKIKGNREVTETFKNLDNFSQIEISDDLEVFMTQSYSNGYRLKTDANLINVIKIEVVDSVLKVYTTSKIKSSKKLEIYLTFQEINKITLRKRSKLTGQNYMRLPNMQLSCYDNAEFELDIESSELRLEMNNGTNGKIKLKSSNTNITLNDNAFLKGTLTSETLDLSIYKRADMNVKGSCDNFNLVTTGSSDVKAKKLHATNVNINASNTSDIFVHATKQLNVFAKGRSYVYVYGNPEIKVDGLNDKSQIIKK